MNKKLHICVDGLNIALREGTGIAVYARQLCQILHEHGYKTSLLFDKAINEAATDALYEISFYDALSKLSDKERKPTSGFAPRLKYYLPLFVKSFKSFFKTSIVKERRLVGMVEKAAFQSRLPQFDTIYNLSRLFRVASVYFRLTQQLLPIKLDPTPDIMHWTSAIPAKVIGAKNYYTLHDVIPLKVPGVLSDHDNVAHYYTLFKKIADSADKILTVSECAKQDIVAWLNIDEKKVTNTYRAVDFHSLASSEEMKFSRHQLENEFYLLPQDYFLFIGAIEPKKNVARLIEAYLRANVSQKLVIVGGLGWQNEVEQALLKRHADKVIYMRYVADDALKTLLRYARALTFPSLYEGFGLPVLEAMAMGVPVITSNVSSLPEVTGDAAYLVNPYSTQELSSAIVRLSQDEARCAELSQKGLVRVQQFSQEKYVERVIAAYL